MNANLEPVCDACQLDNCYDCSDVVRVALGEEPLCPCGRKGHTGEAGDRHFGDTTANNLVIFHMEQHASIEVNVPPDGICSEGKEVT